MTNSQDIEVIEGNQSKLSNEDLAKMYASQVFLGNPSEKLTGVLTDIMRERGIVPKEIIVGCKFEANGEEFVIHAMTL